MNATHSFRLFTLCLLAAITTTANRAEAVNVFTETFDGQFDNTWTTIGDGGTFTTNGFSENVLAVSSSSAGADQDGISRVLGDGPFQALVEISNPSLGSTLASAVMRITDNGGDDTVYIGLQGASGGGIDLSFGYGIGAPILPTVVGFVPLGGVTNMLTLKLIHEPDTINGGGIFSAFYDIDESGTFLSLGSIDGTDYTTDGAASRKLLLTTQVFGSTADMELDYAQVVPEPASIWLAALGALMLTAMGWKRVARVGGVG